jgi:NAD(P)-dependent dehydrogenase (short-subunit alcohol dehydrogenase family)
LGLAIITGGSRGLGAALCDLYRERGWHVVEFSRSAPHSYSVPVDLSDPQAAAHVFAKTFAALAASSPPEVVAISNAGVLGPVGPVEHAPWVEIRANLEVNVVSAILFARQLAAAFQDHRCPKTFVNISSGAATKGRAGWSLYCAGKAALENYVRAVALEQAARAHPFRAISVNPGAMDTAMQAAVRSSSARDFPELERYLRLYREGRLAPPSSVASRIAEIVASRPESGGVYLASP